jgi:hypothetical protein
MSAISLICACKDDDRAHAIRRRLVAEGHDVRIAHREVDNSDWRPEGNICTVVLWSNESKDCHPVRQMARAADATHSLVHVTLEPSVTLPIATISTPVDLSHWRGEGAGQWRLLEERIERAERREDIRSPNHHFFPALANAVIVVTIVGFSILLRMEDGPAPAHTTTTLAPTPLEQLTPEFPKTNVSIGGPEVVPVVLESEDIVVRVARLQQLRLPRMTVPELATPRPLAQVQFRRTGVLGQILRVSERLPFVGDNRTPSF